MQFTQNPDLYASTGKEILFVLEQDSPGNIDIRILNRSADTILGARRFPETTKAEFDAAPLASEALVFNPSTGGTGFKDNSGRTFIIQAQAFVSGTTTDATYSFLRNVIPGHGDGVTKQILTSMPLERLITAGACDELTLFNDQNFAVTVCGTSRDSTVAEKYNAPNPGLQIFRLDTRDFPECDTITVDAGACGTVVYTVIPASQCAVRLAWRSRAGSIEHYSFPVVRDTTLRCLKQRTEGVDGHQVTASEYSREATLVSAYERPEILEALAEITSAQEVWFTDGDSYTPADILTEEAVVQRHGTLCSLELIVRPKNNTVWN